MAPNDDNWYQNVAPFEMSPSDVQKEYEQLGAGKFNLPFEDDFVLVPSDPYTQF